MSVVRHSGANAPNDGVVEITEEYRDSTGDNLDFFLDAFQRLANQDTGRKKKGVGNKGLMCIGLVGERDLIGVTLRQAQSVVRFDRRPSKWSHAFLIAGEAPSTRAELANLKVLEVTMSPRGGALADPNSNGLTFGKLGNYASPMVTANVALLAVDMNDEEAGLVEFKARRPNRDRIRYNMWDSLCVWQGYYWAQGARPNPLSEGFPIFSSSYIEYAFEAIDLDITPAASERNSAPEHLWNSARWWHENLDDLGHPIYGYSVIRDPGCSVLYQDEVADAADVVAKALEESGEGE
ncbi:MAG TPA: hypothetical protein VHJ78_01625 [Actinomycetota bacterium]|nr:hypothetical protein [Actinomycetota bacterium]